MFEASFGVRQLFNLSGCQELADLGCGVLVVACAAAGDALSTPDSEQCGLRELVADFIAGLIDLGVRVAIDQAAGQNFEPDIACFRNNADHMQVAVGFDQVDVAVSFGLQA